MQRIWIAEDDADIREELAALLRGNGYLPVEEPPCELALIDVNLPGESGFELCRKWKEKSAAPVIFLTARTAAALVYDKLTPNCHLLNNLWKKADII